MAESGITTVRIPRLGVGVQPPKPLLFLDALEESPSDHLDLPADGSCIGRDGSGDAPGQTAAARRRGRPFRHRRDLLTCGFSPG
jgi:hypothetical protein